MENNEILLHAHQPPRMQNMSIYVSVYRLSYIPDVIFKGKTLLTKHTALNEGGKRER